MNEVFKMNIEKNFNFQEVDEMQIEKFKKIRASSKELAFLMNKSCPHSREKALALTNLEQAAMWAIASIAREGR